MISKSDGSSFLYGKHDVEILNLSFRGEIIQEAAPDRFFVSTGMVSLGETSVQVYGRFGSGKGLFDIYRFGMDGDLATASSNYDCRELNQ